MSQVEHVEAVYRRGVFEPLKPVELPENQRVRLAIERAEPNALARWLEEARVLREELLARHGGPFPDSTPDIAEDRLR